MQSRKSGYFLVYRDVWNHKVFKNKIEAAIWLYMISSASHKDKTARFMDNLIPIKRGQLIFPLRMNAKIWGISYQAMRSFILRLKRRKMVSHVLTTLQPSPNYKWNKISLISIENYDKFQYVDEMSHVSTTEPDNLIHYSNTLISNISPKKEKDESTNKGYKFTGEKWGQYGKIVINGKKMWKHLFNDKLPLKEEL